MRLSEYKIYALILIVGLVSACASTPEDRAVVAQEETAGLSAPTQEIAGFTAYRLLPIEMAPAVSEDPGKVAVSEELGIKLETRLSPLIAQWNETSSATAEQGTLVIRPVVASLRVVSGGARFFAGAFAGNSFIDLDLELVNESTGEVIAKPRIDRNAGAWSGAWSFGKSDKSLSDYIVDIAHEYLESNYN